MAGDSSHGVSRVVHHKDFYLRGGDLTVLVENHLYRIHSYFFERESLFFRQKFNFTNNSNGDDVPGSTDNNAYTLEDVKSEDFARFLWVFYNPKYSVYEAPLETWLSILQLANRWTFDNVKELSVRELEKIEIEAVEKIAIYHDNNISRLYLIPSYIAVCKRDKPLSFREGTKLGMETVLRVAEARERLRLQASESGIRSPTFEDFEDTEVETLIREIFNLGSRPTSPSVTSPTNGVNGSLNGTHVKLNPAPPGNPLKANGAGAAASRANGVLAADNTKYSAVDPMPSISAVMSNQPQGLGAVTQTQTPASATPPTPTPATAQQEQRPPVPPVKTAPAPSPSQPPAPPPTADKPKDSKDGASQETGNLFSSLQSPKSKGAGEPSSSAGSGASSLDDVSNTKPVVSPTEHSNDVSAESNDNVGDGEKDESSKDNETGSVLSDNEANKPGKQQGGRNANRRAKGNPRGGKKST